MRGDVILEPCRVELLEVMGSDLSVVNAARVSFDRASTWADPDLRVLRESDAQLIRFLARGYRSGEWDALADELLSLRDRRAVQVALSALRVKAQHWAPFAHPHVSMRVTMPVFAARQFVKHQVGGVWSEVSRRYVSRDPTFWLPQEWCDRPADIKQGCGVPVPDQAAARDTALSALRASLSAYRALLASGVAPEEARLVLPLSHMTTVVWTGSLLFWARVVNLRADAHAQRAATREIAGMIADIMGDLFPVSWPELVPSRKEE